MTQVAEPGSARTDTPTPGRVSHWIGGALVAGTSGREGPVYDPATGTLTRHVDLASIEEVGAAVAAAKAAFPAGARPRCPSAPTSCSRSGTWSRPTATRSPRT